MKKIALKLTICLMITIFELSSPNIGNFGSKNSVSTVYASTHSVKKVKKIKNS